MKVFLDLDGVLASWVEPMLRLTGHDTAEVFARWEQLDPRPWNIFDVVDMSASQGWRAIDQAGDRFWANLPLMPHARELFARCEAIGETTILTAPSYDRSSQAGKAQWLDYHFGKGFARDRALLGASKHVVARPGALLIDDSPRNCAQWAAEGGSSILFPALGNERYRLADDPLTAIEPALVRARLGKLKEGEQC